MTPGAPLVSRWSRDIEKSPGTILAGYAEHILTCAPMPRRCELASGGAERRVFAARSRRVPSAIAKVLHVPAVLRSWDDVEGPIQLIVRSAIIRPIMGSAMMAASRPEQARVLSEHRRGNGGGKNYHCT